jgi:hypothetical protein
MAGYTIRTLEEIPDVLGDYPGEMRMSAASDLGTEQVGFTWRRMPPLTGGKGSYGHRHKTQEEVYFGGVTAIATRRRRRSTSLRPGRSSSSSKTR